MVRFNLFVLACSAATSLRQLNEVPVPEAIEEMYKLESENPIMDSISHAIENSSAYHALNEITGVDVDAIVAHGKKRQLEEEEVHPELSTNYDEYPMEMNNMGGVGSIDFGIIENLAENLSNANAAWIDRIIALLDQHKK